MEMFLDRYKICISILNKVGIDTLRFPPSLTTELFFFHFVPATECLPSFLRGRLS